VIIIMEFALTRFRVDTQMMCGWTRIVRSGLDFNIFVINNNSTRVCSSGELNSAVCIKCDYDICLFSSLPTFFFCSVLGLVVYFSVPSSHVVIDMDFLLCFLSTTIVEAEMFESIKGICWLEDESGRKKFVRICDNARWLFTSIFPPLQSLGKFGV
jgi:hypothetical protein